MPTPSRRRNVLRNAASASLIALTALTTACSSDSKVENDISKLKSFSLSDAPTFTLTDDGTPEHTFARISARHLANGNIAIHDEPANRIVIFDRSGKLVREVTHRGGGPGEMDQMFRMNSMGDTIIAIPFATLVATSVFDANTGFVEQYSPRASNYDKGMAPLARMPNHHWLVAQGAGFRALTAAVVIGDLIPDTLTVGIVGVGKTPETTNVHWLPSFVGSWSVGSEMPKPSPMPALPTNFPMKGAMLYAPSGLQVWLVDAESGAFTILDSTATAILRDTLRIARRPFVQSEIAAAKDAELANARGPFLIGMVQGRYNAKAMPALMPRFSAIYAGDDGEAWIQLYEVAPTAPQKFIAMSRAGKPIGNLTLPAGFRIHQLGRDFVLGVKADSLGTETVAEYAIKRN